MITRQPSASIGTEAVQGDSARPAETRTEGLSVLRPEEGPVRNYDSLTLAQICIDLSDSVVPAREAICQGVRAMLHEFQRHQMARHVVDLQIITFNSEVKVYGFRPAGESSLPEFSFGGNTMAGEATRLMAKSVRERLQFHAKNGTAVGRIIAAHLFDGQPSDDFESAAAEVRAIEREHANYHVFPIGVGPEPLLKALSQLSDRRRPALLKDFKYQELFGWFTATIIRSTQTRVGERLTPASAMEWMSGVD